MTRSERQVAGFVLGHMNDIVFFTLDELAEKTEVSTTSVLRFCRRLGFDGFKQFQQTVRDELRYSPNLLEKFRRTTNTQLEDSLLAQTVQQGILCIQETFQELSYDSLSDAVEILSTARRVYTFGMRESQALASYTYSRLLTVRGDVFMYHDGYSENIETLLSVTDDDVFVVFLFKRYTEKTLGLLEVLRQRGVRIILVTSPPTDEVARFATILLPCRVDANGIKNSSLAPVCLADYLCNTVAMADPQAAMKRMKESEQLFRQSEILRD
jgi:DNA-binding MurR/RpiR family transcriptional regulator